MQPILPIIIALAQAVPMQPGMTLTYVHRNFDRDRDDDGRRNDPPAPHDAADVDPQRNLDVVCATGVHRLRVDEFQTAGGVRRPVESAAICSESESPCSRITCVR